MAVTRYYEATIKIECCKSGEPVYSPDLIRIKGKTTKDRFESTLIEWGDEVHDRLDNKHRPKAEDQCKAVGTRRLCRFIIQVKRWEEGKPECPDWVLKEIRRLEDSIEEIKRLNDEAIDRYERIKSDGINEKDSFDSYKSLYGGGGLNNFIESIDRTIRNHERTNGDAIKRQQENINELLDEYPECRGIR